MQQPEKFGTREWAEQNVNFIDGCIHDCKYCYSKEMAIRFGRRTHDLWKQEVVRAHNLKKTYRKMPGLIMFPSSHDITPDHLESSLSLLKSVLEPGNQVLIVTKPHLDCITALCEQLRPYKSQIQFRFTIGSLDSNTLRFWEPGAPTFEERFASLRHAFNEGYSTSLSCEPMLDSKVEELIAVVQPFITDTIWIGKANFLLRRLKMNGELDAVTTAKASHLIESQSDTNIRRLYERLSTNPMIRWKESISKVLFPH